MASRKRGGKETSNEKLSATRADSATKKTAGNKSSKTAPTAKAAPVAKSAKPAKAKVNEKAALAEAIKVGKFAARKCEEEILFFKQNDSDEEREESATSANISAEIDETFVSAAVESKSNDDDFLPTSLRRSTTEISTVLDKVETPTQLDLYDDVPGGCETPLDQVSLHRTGSTGRSIPPTITANIAREFDNELTTPKESVFTCQFVGQGSSTIIKQEPKFHSDSIKRMYHIMRTSGDKLDPGNHRDGIYGEITSGCMAIILTLLEKHCGLNKEESRFLDLGSGLGKPVQHAAPFVSMSVGIEQVDDRNAVRHFTITSAVHHLLPKL